MGADVVEEVAVVADHQHRALVVHEEVLQPHHAGEVKVVGGLVEQQHVRVAEERLGQQHLDLQARVKLPHEKPVQGNVHAQSLEDPPRVAFGLVAAELGIFLLQLRRAQAVFVVEVLLLVDGVLLLAALVEPLVPHDDGLEHHAVVVEALVLLEHRHAALGLERDRTAGGLQLPGEDFNKGRFPRAVGADDSVAVPGGKLQIDLGEEHRGTELHGQIVDSEHG